MIVAPKPSNETSRLDTLRNLLILDTEPEQRFDRITEFARFEFDVSTVLISLIDSDRQWFKSKVGLNACETSRDISFCGHAILENKIMIVEDASKDERFHDNPLVIGEPYIRFYAGAQLELEDGVILGTLCLIDNKPRSLDTAEIQILSALRTMVVEELKNTESRS